jgi:hypothetical protein
MSELWIIRAEITVQPEDFPSGDTVGFINVITWADSVETIRSKLSSYLETFDWHLLKIEDAHLVDSDLVYHDEIEDMIERASNNPQSILLGTFFSYKVN